VFGLANILDLLKMTFKYFNVKSTCFFFWGMCVVFLGGCLQQIQVRSGRMFSSSNSDDWHPSTSAVELRTFRLSHTTVRFVFGVTGPRSRHLSIMQHFTSDTEFTAKLRHPMSTYFTGLAGTICPCYWWIDDKSWINDEWIYGYIYIYGYLMISTIFTIFTICLWIDESG
jgi:hypothetical protein